MILRGTSTSGIPLPVPAQSAASAPRCVPSPSGCCRRRRGLPRHASVELSDAAITGSDDVIVDGKDHPFGGNEPRMPIDGKDDVIFCHKCKETI